MIRHYKEDEYTPEEAQAELMELLIKSGRRCAYDLSHASDYMVAGEFQQKMQQRANHWLSVFNAGKDHKNYRTQLHGVIDDLERRVDGLLKLCEANGIDAADFKDFPF